MIYGNATFMGVPFETIIKMFRERLGKNVYPELKEYAKHFIEYLNKNKINISKREQEEYIMFVVESLLNQIKMQIENNWKEEIEKVGKIDLKRMKKIASIIIKNFACNLSNDKLECFSSSFLVKLKKNINKVFIKKLKELFQGYPLSSPDKKNLKEIINSAITKDNFPNIVSGVVIAGFGENEIYPAIESYSVEALFSGKLKYKLDRRDNIDSSNNASIIPFAQSEMVSTFMEGVDPNYQQVKRSYLENIFRNYPELIIKNSKKLNKLKKKEQDLIKAEFGKLSMRLFNDYKAKMEKFTREKHINQVLDVVGILPKDELAAMAESLVNLTSFKRRVTMAQETVGGPIDVAVISKGDGFIWIKRKHYFKPELNRQFFDNYFRREGAKSEGNKK
jgi:hypothetical protein